MAPRYKKILGFTTAAILIYQLIVLTRNHCYTERIRHSLTHALIERDEVFPSESPSNISWASNLNTTEFRSPDKRWLTIGIPTVQRRDGSYFPIMLKSLLNKTDDNYLNKIYIVIFLADFNNTKWKDDLETQLRRNYSRYFDLGTLKVVRAPQTFYSGFKLSQSTPKFLYWKTKQNFDYAFIMRYCEPISHYYMQMEDDVITADEYLNSISDFIEAQTNDIWTCLEFSELGFIGKLYHNRDIRQLSQMFLMFNQTQPCDIIYLYFNILRDQLQRLIRKPTLFQHVGYHSSLPDKIQPLKDHYFNLPKKKYQADNPRAELHTTLSVFQGYPPENAYSNTSSFFWSSSSPKEGDMFTIRFYAPQLIEKVIIETGTSDYPDDKLYVGLVEASTVLSSAEEPPYCTDFVVVGRFENGIANITDMGAKMGVFATKCLQITVTKDQTRWVIIREIAVWVRK